MISPQWRNELLGGNENYSNTRKNFELKIYPNVQLGYIDLCY